jgi:hypothetical protein
MRKEIEIENRMKIRGKAEKFSFFSQFEEQRFLKEKKREIFFAFFGGDLGTLPFKTFAQTILQILRHQIVTYSF